MNRKHPVRRSCISHRLEPGPNCYALCLVPIYNSIYDTAGFRHSVMNCEIHWRRIYFLLQWISQFILTLHIHFQVGVIDIHYYIYFLYIIYMLLFLQFFGIYTAKTGKSPLELYWQFGAERVSVWHARLELLIPLRMHGLHRDSGPSFLRHFLFTSLTPTKPHRAGHELVQEP